MKDKLFPYGQKDLFLTSVSSGLLAFLCCTQKFAGTSELQWPEGKYGLPMVAPSLCPSSYNFSWVTGSRYQDTAGANQRSTNFNLASRVNSNSVEQHFCIKDVDTNDDTRPSWPEGRYCVYKKGPTCPYSLTEGWVFWDDKNEENKNAKEGILPNGTYNQDTKIYFCCQTVGSVFDTIYLPVDKPFYLIALKSLFAKNPVCQAVHGAVAAVEYISYGVENSSDVGGIFPYGANIKPDLLVYYCYYSACRYNMSKISGGFTSPMFPGEYSDNTDCTWQINRRPNYTIELSFPVFELETSKYCNGPNCPCDYIDIVESSSENGADVFIGRYCNLSALPEVVKSTADHLKVYFHSDSNVRGKGFKASYEMKLPHKQGKSSTTSVPLLTITTGIGDSSNHTETDTTKAPDTTEKLPLEIVIPAVSCFVIAVVLVIGVSYCWSKKKHSRGHSRSLPSLVTGTGSLEASNSTSLYQLTNNEARL